VAGLRTAQQYLEESSRRTPSFGLMTVSQFVCFLSQRLTIMVIPKPSLVLFMELYMKIPLEVRIPCRL